MCRDGRGGCSRRHNSQKIKLNISSPEPRPEQPARRAPNGVRVTNSFQARQQSPCFTRTLAALLLASALTAPVSAPAEAGRLHDKLDNVKQRIKLDIRAFKCVLNKGPCGF